MGAATSAEAEDGVIGRWVLITGLLRSPQFNGQWGLAEAYDAEMHRYVVRVLLGSLHGEGTGDSVAAQPVLAKLRRENFVVIPARDAPLPNSAAAPALALGPEQRTWHP